QRVLGQAEQYDFRRIVDRRGLRLAFLALLTACVLAVPLTILNPTAAATALGRLLDPFGPRQWPTQTTLVVTAPERVGRGSPFELHGRLWGVIPEQATVTFWFDGRPPSEPQTWRVIPGERPGEATLVARLEPERVRSSFRFQVQAHDAVTIWHEVIVLPPPRFVALAGRPSPQVRLTYPAYTDLPPLNLPPASSDAEAVLGTRVEWRAAVDRPLARVWLEWQPDRPDVIPAAILFPLAGEHPLAAAGWNLASAGVWERIPVQLDTSRQVLSATFVPLTSGSYWLHMEDDTGLPGNPSRHILNIWQDPAPLVALERPSASLDSLYLLPDAEVTVHLLARDEQFALRSVYLEYRTRPDDPPRRWPFYDYARTSSGLAQVQAGFAAAPLPLPTPWPRLRPTYWTVRQRWSLANIRHLDGSPLREGDVVLIQGCATDFDDVWSAKDAGRSHEIELHIVGMPALEAQLNQTQAEVQQELLRLREHQRDALKKVAAAEKQWRNTGQLRPEEVDQLMQAEQLQQQIRGRVGNDEQEGLRAAVKRALQMIRDNHLPASGAKERLAEAAAELERLANEELNQIEPHLTNARKENELVQEPRPPDKTARGPLTNARQHQEEADKTFNALLARLEPWSQIREVQGEAKNLLDEQRRLIDETDQLSKQLPLGQRPETLTPEQRAELDKTADRQNRAADHVKELLDKMDRLSTDKERLQLEKEKLADDKSKQADQKERQASAKYLQALELAQQNPMQSQQAENEARALREVARALRKEAELLRETSQTLQEEREALRQAAQRGRQNQLDPSLTQAGVQIRDNRLGEASQSQQTGVQALEKMLQALEEKREQELDRLGKKLRQAEDKLAQLVEEQERLQKRLRDAQQLTDPQERELELRRLSRQQDELRQQAQELLQELNRLRASRAGDALSRAGNQMDQANQQLTRGDDPQEAQEEALERLNEARRELERNRQEVEEQLIREKLAKIEDQINRLRERQEALITEAARIHRLVLRNKNWERGSLASLSNLARAQQGLAEETKRLAENKLAGALVFERAVQRAAEVMTQAQESMYERRDQALDRRARGEDLDADAEHAADQETQHWQRLALSRLDQVVEALKPEKNVPLAAQRPNDGQPQENGAQPRPGDSIPPLAQLKLLKAMQEEIHQRTEKLAQAHPDLSKLTPEAVKELEAIRKDQEEVAELFEHINSANEPEGEQP
ncbi:MAG: hypothetical protein ACK4RK_13060, partial [Gemmataceae bacterium]